MTLKYVFIVLYTNNGPLSVENKFLLTSVVKPSTVLRPNKYSPEKKQYKLITIILYDKFLISKKCTIVS